MLELVLGLWAAASVVLVWRYSVCSSRLLRARIAGRDGEAVESRSSMLGSLLKTAFDHGSMLLGTQTDPVLEPLTRATRRTLAAFLVFTFFGLAALMALASLPGRANLTLLTSLDDVTVSRVIVIAVYGSIILYMGWMLADALSGGPDWRSGRQDDPVRYPRSLAILTGVVMIVAATFGLVFAWVLAG